MQIGTEFRWPASDVIRVWEGRERFTMNDAASEWRDRLSAARHALANAESQAVSVLTMIGIGIMWASIVGVPYLMVASMVPAGKAGIYMGVLNMMIVVPMLIETVTFGWIFKNLLDDDPFADPFADQAEVATPGVSAKRGVVW